jgi:EAL domain-containing protein (putative c-di-GMP-specific phosphodiesterase class I)
MVSEPDLAMLLPLLRTPDQTADDAMGSALSAIRTHLGMEVAYISEFVGDRSVFREVDAPGLETLIKAGDSRSLDDVYCRHILAGRLPELMADTADYALARSMPITRAVPIGAHMSVPVRRADGSVLGMFCCLSPTPNRSLNERDLQVMKVFADMAGTQLAVRLDREREAEVKRVRVGEVLDERAFKLVYQPIWEIGAARPSGFEVLCRFTREPFRSPDRWFAEAAETGNGVALETAVLRKAITSFDDLPSDIYLSVNASPETVLSGALPDLFEGAPAERLVLELTEHAPVGDYDVLEAALAPLRARGIRLAVDDAGAGYSGLQHIIRLKPDLIKLDMSLTRTIHEDPARQALASALIFFARMTGCIIIAEGVETQEELATLRTLGVPRAQGYFLSRPVELAAAQDMSAVPSRLSRAG